MNQFCMPTDYGHTTDKSLILCGPNSNPKGLVFCRNNGWFMENMDKGLIVPKWVLIDSSAKYTPNAPKFSAQFVFPSPNIWDIAEKWLHWASVVRGACHTPLKGWRGTTQIHCGIFFQQTNLSWEFNENWLGFKRNKAKAEESTLFLIILLQIIFF